LRHIGFAWCLVVRFRPPEPRASAESLVHLVEAATEDRPIEMPLGEFAPLPGQRRSRAGFLKSQESRWGIASNDSTNACTEGVSASPRAPVGVVILGSPAARYSSCFRFDPLPQVIGLIARSAAWK